MKETGFTYADLRRESGINIFQHNNINSGMGFQTLIQFLEIMGYEIILRNRSDSGDYLKLRLNRYESEKWGNIYTSTGEGSPDEMLLLRHNTVTEKEGIAILLDTRTTFLRKMDPRLFDSKMPRIASQYESDRSMYCRYVFWLVEYLGYEVIIKDTENGDYWRMIVDGERDQPRKK